MSRGLILGIAFGAVMTFGSVAVVAYGVHEVSTLYYYEQHLGEQLRKELGFAHGTPYVPEGGPFGLGVEVLTISDLRPAGVFEKAGFRKNDIILGLTTKDFYRSLETARGESITFSVHSWDGRSSIRNLPMRKLSVTIPEQPVVK